MHTVRLLRLTVAFMFVGLLTACAPPEPTPTAAVVPTSTPTPLPTATPSPAFVPPAPPTPAPDPMGDLQSALRVFESPLFDDLADFSQVLSPDGDSILGGPDLFNQLVRSALDVIGAPTNIEEFLRGDRRFTDEQAAVFRRCGDWFANAGRSLLEALSAPAASTRERLLGSSKLYYEVGALCLGVLTSSLDSSQ